MFLAATVVILVLKKMAVLVLHKERACFAALTKGLNIKSSITGIVSAFSLLY